jgi:hypothetical protein
VSLLEDNPRALEDLLSEIHNRATVPLDFHCALVITSKLLTDEGIDDRHAFPAAYLERNGVAPAWLRDCAPNRTLAHRIHRMVGDRAPWDYLAEIRGTSAFHFERVLDAHCLPSNASSPLLSDGYDTFVIWRQGRIWRETRRATGATTATDLEAQGGSA